MGKILNTKKPSGSTEFDFYLQDIWEAIENRTRILDRPGKITVAYTEKGIELTPVGSGVGGSSTGVQHRGEWSSSTQYAAQNIVSRGNLGEFIAFSAPPVATAPETGAPYWHSLNWASPGVWA